MASSTRSNRFVTIFDKLWKSDAFLHDLEFDAHLTDVVICDEASSSGVDFLSGPEGAEELRNFLIQRLDSQNTRTGGLHGLDLCVFILRAVVVHLQGDDRSAQILRAQTICEVIEVMLTDEEMIEDIKLDFPKVEDALRTVRDSFACLFDASRSCTTSSSHRPPKKRRLRILAVRNGLNPHSDLAKKIRQFAELRIPSSPLVRETGIEDPGGAAGEEMRKILTAHLKKRKPLYEEDLLSVEQAVPERQPFYDLFLTYSRGAVYLEKILGSRGDFEIPALVLSPPGEMGRDLLAMAASRRHQILVAYAGNDIIPDPDNNAKVEDDGASRASCPQHPVVALAEVEDLLNTHGNEEGVVVFERERMQSWADGVASLVEQAVGRYW